MKKFYIVFLIIVGFLTFTLEGMEKNLSLNFKLGQFRTNQHAEDQPEYTIGPEIEMESKIF